jgi:tetratricopeptide (TPR) repeat protein
MKRFSNLILLIDFLFTIGLALSAQDTAFTTLKGEARIMFEELNFEKALPLYRQLLNRFPKEPEYQFRTAVCLTRLNSDPGEAIPLLRSAGTSGYDPLSFYYLGLLLHRNYMFEDAIKAYSKFILLGKAADIKALNVERQIEMAKNAIEFTHKRKLFTVLDVKTMNTLQLENASEINGSGKMVKKPVEFCSKNDLREGYRPFMFLPVYTEMNDYVFTSGYEKHKKGLRQIYRIRNINHETWSKPELLDPVINTPYDEEYPYFDARSSVLYFSSKGHSSMGGYDIFRSVYNWNTKSWSIPENLGFPINSPCDDFFYMTDGISQNASLVSNRNSGPGQVTLYKIKMTGDTTGISLLTIGEMQDASRLQVEKVRLPAEAINSVPEAKVPVDSISDIHRFSQKDYNMVLAEALNLQLRSDSLGRIVRDKRLTAKEAPDDNLKKQLIADIIHTEKESKKLQREADLKFGEARKMKGNEDDLHNEDTVMVMTKEINGTRVYSYKPDVPAPSQNAGTVSVNDRQEKSTLTENSVTVTEDDFKLLDKSPYDPSNPIPRGLNSHRGLVYRIQLGAFSKPRPDNAFGGISPVCYEQVNGSSILKYFAGLFFSLNRVTMALEQVRKNGFPDAFIVAFLDDKPIATDKAREIEFEGFKL